MKHRNHIAGRIALIVCLTVVTAACAQTDKTKADRANAETQAGQANTYAKGGRASAATQTGQKPVYIDIIPIADADKSVLPGDVVSAMASQALSRAKRKSVRLHGQQLPANADVLRIMYIVHQQSAGDGLSLSASAATEKLHTVDEGDKVLRTLLDYSGMQQSMTQAPDIRHARQRLRSAFKKELQARITTAFQTAPAQANAAE